MTDTPPPDRMLAGRYRIDGRIGRGGMGEVFHGYDERLDRPVAIKMLRQPTAAAGDDSPEALELLDAQRRDRVRFLREIRTAARLEHPGTPAVYDTGTEEQPDGTEQVWLVMQLLRGSTLETLLDDAVYDGDATPPVAWAAAIGAQIAAVLADVHRVDVVHRDIKPANIMVVDGGLVKVLDFGIAILRGAGALPRLTQVDRTVGTPAYMSPEQHLGRAVTGASDVYSLGCLVFELLTGDPPYHRDGDGTPLRAHHVQARVPSVRNVRHEVPAELDALVTAMLAKDPDARPTAEDVYRALTPLVHGTPPRGETGKDTDRDPVRPFRTPLLAPPPRHPARARRQPLTDDELDVLMGNVAALVEADNGAAALRLMDDGLQRAPAGSYAELDLRYRLGTALFYEGEYRRSAALLTAAGEGFRANGLAPAAEHVLECAYLAGHAYVELDDTAAALIQLRYYVHHSGRDDERLLDTRFVIAQLLAAEDRPDEALAELQALRPAFEDRYGPGSVHVRNLDRQVGRLRHPEVS